MSTAVRQQRPAQALALHFAFGSTQPAIQAQIGRHCDPLGRNERSELRQ
jgi:hypothetical protein